MDRRQFCKSTVAALASAWFTRRTWADASASRPSFPTSDPAAAETWDAAVTVLQRNIQRLPGFDQDVLIEGSTYAGIWQECGPHEGLVYASLADDLPPELAAHARAVAKANHLAFFALQKPDGQLPANVKTTGVGFGQIQMVVPIAATAWELVQLTRDDHLLGVAYDACSRWNAWLRKYRNTRGTGLVEGFCTFDTGHDNSPRWSWIPNRCPDGDARICPPIDSLPRLCPDLSATVYGGRIALAAMAEALGKNAEAARWRDDAETIRRLIIEKLYSPEDAAFYDLDAHGQFINIRSDVITRVLGEHVLKLDDARDRAIFDDLGRRQLFNLNAFWTRLPFPSVAENDPQYIRNAPPNCWGGPSQALTALRTPRWMPHYGKNALFIELMRRWTRAIAEQLSFCQQGDPDTTSFSRPDPGGYTPAALVYLDFTRRLAGGDPKAVH